jgi:hypothetical protein
MSEIKLGISFMVPGLVHNFQIVSLKVEFELLSAAVLNRQMDVCTDMSKTFCPSPLYA